MLYVQYYSTFIMHNFLYLYTGSLALHFFILTRRKQWVAVSVLLVLLLWSAVSSLFFLVLNVKLSMLRFKSALNMHTAQRSLRLSRQPMGASRWAAEQWKIWKTSVNGALDCLWQKWRATYEMEVSHDSYYVLQGFFALQKNYLKEKCMCVRVLVFRGRVPAVMQGGLRPPCKLYATGGKRGFKLL